MIRVKWAVIGISWMFCCGIVYAQPPSGLSWHLAKDEGKSIQVYTADIGTTKRKYIKVEALLPGSLNRVAEVFRDIGNQKTWVYKTRKSFLVQRPDDRKLVYYNETDLPWPVSNRDVVISMKMEMDALQRSLVIIQEAQSGILPPKKGIVRVSHLKGYWKFQENEHQKLQVEYYLDIDPGGSLPTWVTNLFITKGPYQTFVKLGELLRH
ncbi:MAG: START domain-containing protein [Flavisolibacter sp.]